MNIVNIDLQRLVNVFPSSSVHFPCDWNPNSNISSCHLTYHHFILFLSSKLFSPSISYYIINFNYNFSFDRNSMLQHLDSWRDLKVSLDHPFIPTLVRHYQECQLLRLTLALHASLVNPTLRLTSIKCVIIQVCVPIDGLLSD